MKYFARKFATRFLKLKKYLYLQDAQKAQADCTLAEKCSDLSDIPKIRLQSKKVLKGHINKVNSVHFAGDSRHCVTGSLDGKLIIWDTWTGNKVQVSMNVAVHL